MVGSRKPSEGDAAVDAPETLHEIGRPVYQFAKTFQKLIEPHRPALWRYCLRLTGSPWDAEDLLQETLMKAFARLTHWQPLEARPYLFRIASNTWVDQQRRARLVTGNLDETVLETAAICTDPGETMMAMEHLVRLLPPRQRVIVLLTEVFDFTAAEVAGMIGATEGAIKSALHRARNSLYGAVDESTAAEAKPVIRPSNRVVTAYLEAFNRRDPDAIATLLTDDATSDIVGLGVEYGKETIQKYSLTDWAADPQIQWAELGTLDGRETVFIYYRSPEHEKALAWLITLGTAGEWITAINVYYFCPELIRYAAEQLGVSAITHGYRF